MGLLDSVIGSVTGGSQAGGSSATSPLVKALLVLLAAKAASSYFSGNKTATPAPAPTPGTPAQSGTITSGILAGMPSLEGLLEKFTGAGLGNKAQSWVGTGQNDPLHPHELEGALGSDTLAKLSAETGLPRDQLLSQLSTALPQVVDKLTPNGRLPTPEEQAHW